MIQQESILDVADNSGAKKVLCIKVLGGFHRRYARMGERLVVAGTESDPGGPGTKGTVPKAVIRMRL
jgi:large subunit ribosomal protein L14